MRLNSRLFLVGALVLVLLTAACGADQGANPTTVVGTILPDMTSTPLGGIATQETAITPIGVGTTVGGLETATGTINLETPTALATSSIPTQNIATQPAATQRVTIGTPRTTAVVPVTGEDVMLVECQFCVDARAHALLVLPDTATFNITSPAASSTTAADLQPACTTVEVNNGRQVVLCSGPEMTPLVVNICMGAGNCTDFPVNLLACPLTQSGVVGPTPTKSAAGTGGTGATATPLPGGVTISTATSSAGVTPTATP